MRYHISPTTGRPNQCNASVRDCPVGGEHYDSKEAAREAYEARNEAVPSPHRKAGDKYDRYDRPLAGTGTGPGGREASLRRAEEKPYMGYEVTDNGFMIVANDKPAFEVASWSEVEIADRVREIAQWSQLRSLMEEDPKTCEHIDDLLTHQSDELDEVVEDLESDRDRVAAFQDSRGMAQYDHSLAEARLAQRLHSATKPAAKFKPAPAFPEATLSNVRSQMVREPGEHPHELILAPDGTDLGNVMYREGMYLAGVHDGRRPRTLGSYETREAAVEALIANKGENQSQR